MAVGLGIIEIIILLVTAALLIGAVVLIVLGLVGRKKASGDGGSCGVCGYSVKGLETLNCPECGADLREVGIHKAAGGNTGRNVMLISGITLLAVLLLCCVGSSFLTFVVGPSSVTTPVHSAPPAHLTPAQPQPAQPQPAPAP